MEQRDDSPSASPSRRCIPDRESICVEEMKPSPPPPPLQEDRSVRQEKPARRSFPPKADIVASVSLAFAFVYCGTLIAGPFVGTLSTFVVVEETVSLLFLLAAMALRNRTVGTVVVLTIQAADSIVYDDPTHVPTLVKHLVSEPGSWALVFSVVLRLITRTLSFSVHALLIVETIFEAASIVVVFFMLAVTYAVQELKKRRPELLATTDQETA